MISVDNAVLSNISVIGYILVKNNLFHRGCFILLYLI